MHQETFKLSVDGGMLAFFPTESERASPLLYKTVPIRPGSYVFSSVGGKIQVARDLTHYKKWGWIGEVVTNQPHLCIADPSYLTGDIPWVDPLWSEQERDRAVRVTREYYAQGVYTLDSGEMGYIATTGGDGVYNCFVLVDKNGLLISLEINTTAT